MSLGNIKGILFDKDGTLIDFQATWFAIADRMALRVAKGDRAGANALLAQAGYDFVGGKFKADSVFAAGTNADIVDLWYAHVTPEGRTAIVKEFDALAAGEGAASAVALPGIPEAIASLRAAGFRLGVATNDSTAGAENTLVALGLAQMFDAVYGYDAVANPKPAPDAARAFCDLTGLAPSKIAVVGDNRHDLEMARRAGAGLAIGVLSGTGTHDSLAPLADVVIKSVADLPAFLNIGTV